MQNVEDCRWLCLKNTACNSFNISPIDDKTVFCELTAYCHYDTDQERKATTGGYNFSLTVSFIKRNYSAQRQIKTGKDSRIL